MPVALERATRVVGLLMHSRKEYVALMELQESVDLDKVEEILKIFVGKIYQRPPLRSSVKRALRVREIYSIEVLEASGRHVLFRVDCESGTYIRKLCHDVGLLLGVGAHMRELRRTAVAHLKESLPAITLHELSEALYLWRKYGDESLMRKVVLPCEYIVAHLPKVLVKDSAVDAIAHGAQLAAPGVALVSKDVARNSKVAVMTLKGELVAVGRALLGAEEMVAVEKGIVVEMERVIMEPKIYPSLWKRGREGGA